MEFKFTVTDAHHHHPIPSPSTVETPIPSIDLEMSQRNHMSGDDSEKVQIFQSPEFQMPIPAEEPNTDTPKIWQDFMKNWPVISQPFTLLIGFILLWGIAHSIFPDNTHASSPIMRLAFLFVGAQISGVLVGLTGLPDILGMLFWGVLFKNVGWGNFEGLSVLETFLREMALVSIMLLAGLGLDWEALKRLFGMVMRLTLVPTIVEVSCVAVMSFFLLKLPWLWAILLGLVITAISPNVVITVLLDLKEQRLGLYKGIHTIIIAVLSSNDIISIFLFSVILGAIFSTGPLSQQILQGPIGCGIGFVFGFVSGVGLCIFPSRKSKYLTAIRFTILVICGTLSVIGSKAIGYQSAGALGCITVAFTAGTGWRRQTGKDSSDVNVYLDLLWKFLKPISFSLIGKEVYFATLDKNTVLYGIIILIACVTLRLIATYATAFGGDLNWKEKAYITISGFPKATVQAALGPVALDYALRQDSKENIGYATTVLMVSVITIILSAPLGAILMVKLSKKWLKQSPES